MWIGYVDTLPRFADEQVAVEVHVEAYTFRNSNIDPESLELFTKQCLLDCVYARLPSKFVCLFCSTELVMGLPFK